MLLPLRLSVLLLGTRKDGAFPVMQRAPMEGHDIAQHDKACKPAAFHWPESFHNGCCRRNNIGHLGDWSERGKPHHGPIHPAPHSCGCGCRSSVHGCN